LSCFIAGHVTGRSVFKISVFPHPIAASIVAACLVVAFFAFQKRLPQFSGWCLWFGTFSIGLLSLR
jgi:hypothetical protein